MEFLAQLMKLMQGNVGAPQNPIANAMANVEPPAPPEVKSDPTKGGTLTNFIMKMMGAPSGQTTQGGQGTLSGFMGKMSGLVEGSGPSPQTQDPTPMESQQQASLAPTTQPQTSRSTSGQPQTPSQPSQTIFQPNELEALRASLMKGAGVEGTFENRASAVQEGIKSGEMDPQGSNYTNFQNRDLNRMERQAPAAKSDVEFSGRKRTQVAENLPKPGKDVWTDETITPEEHNDWNQTWEGAEFNKSLEYMQKKYPDHEFYFSQQREPGTKTFGENMIMFRQRRTPDKIS